MEEFPESLGPSESSLSHAFYEKPASCARSAHLEAPSDFRSSRNSPGQCPTLASLLTPPAIAMLGLYWFDVRSTARGWFYAQPANAETRIAKPCLVEKLQRFGVHPFLLRKSATPLGCSYAASFVPAWIFDPVEKLP